jgi:hypothetical protein
MTTLEYLNPQPLLVRPKIAGEKIARMQLLVELVAGGRLRPMIGRPRLTLYSVKHLDASVRSTRTSSRAARNGRGRK